MDMPQPSDLHRSLARLAGNWSGKPHRSETLGTRMESSKDGDDWSTMLEGTYRRVEPPRR